MMKKYLLIPLTLLLLAANCKRSNNESLVNKLLFPVENDVKLGQQLKEEIAADPSQYPILNAQQYPKAYEILEGMKKEILASSDVRYRDEFAWELRIIHDDKTLNAFAAPGGYIYVYTGLIKYLDSSHQLAGVLGHEIAHADRRHSINQLKKQYGTQMLLEIALGQNSGKVKQILGSLLSLKFSRSDEAEADDYSVKYLCGTKYRADGAAGFFEKIQSEGGGGTPEFLSTHPSPENRVRDIKAKYTEMSCDGNTTTGQYQLLLNSIP
jgi:predicted Zn-dependent protease